MYATRTVKKGFTLIEILIVVIILGILAAIVIPQFANASTQAKTSAVQSTVQTLRSQIALYKLQHSDVLPGGGTGTTFSSGQFWTDLTTQTDTTGAAWTNSTANQSAGGPWGPYMQSTPKNSLTGGSTVSNGTAPAAGSDFVYDYAAAKGTGNIFGAADTTGSKFVP